MLKQPINTWPRRLWRAHAVWIEAALAVLLVALAAAGPALAAGTDAQHGAGVPTSRGPTPDAAVVAGLRPADGSGDAAVRVQRPRGRADAPWAVR